MDATEELLRRLAANDESCVQSMLTPEPRGPAALDRATRALVQLAALLAVDAATASLHWAAELASTTGVDDAALVRVLQGAAAAAGAAQTVTSAPRLALALGIDLEVDGWDGT